ncbi:SAM-dependent methyltransferase [Salinarimonas ramus]|uniref:Replicative DNA helicase n=1 Tax=Salinarimonas ramus TaxID=690164 RepID=A0A917Q6G1_9HYPH|nr:cyclopropane-fatty-acyl-phospholipid synthase family protein [Salinarimonas ramus]GGK31664.1 replicative DNA helicase [Salinarimonas ramus]
MELLLRKLCDLAVRGGRLEVITARGTRFVAGDGPRDGPPPVAMRFTDKAAERALVLFPEMKLGELITDGRLVIERGTIYDLLTLLMRGRPGGRGVWGSRLMRKLRRAALAVFARNDERRARANVAHHYDLDHRLYDLFLDADRQYSCAYFETPRTNLEEAQLAKKRHVTAKLLVEPGHEVLDIGCGWGGLALYLAGVAGAGRVRGVTLSEEQHRMAGERARREGLASRVEIALQDYRHVTGDFDRIVSVGMFEHVGPAHYAEFFGTTARLLRQDGVMLLHTIGSTAEPGPTNPWITRYIFPGGHVPTLSEMIPAIERSGLQVADVEVLRLHYAQTLRAWRERFLARREEAARLLDERFCRMWEFYLASCEAAFRYEDLVVFQLQLTHRNDVVPLTRDYVGERERMLKGLEAGTTHREAERRTG